MLKEGLIEQLKTQQYFFLNTISCLTEEDSGFRPNEEMYTVAQHIGHTAHSITWFFDGVFGENGFDMNFENYSEKMQKFTSLDQGVKDFKEAIEKGIELLNKLPESELMKPITGEIMTGAPRAAAVSGIADHTAHHRGALSVYARLLGKKPTMPYGKM